MTNEQRNLIFTIFENLRTFEEQNPIVKSHPNYIAAKMNVDDLFDEAIADEKKEVQPEVTGG